MQVKELSFLLEWRAGREESPIRAESTLVLRGGQGDRYSSCPVLDSNTSWKVIGCLRTGPGSFSFQLLRDQPDYL